MNMSLTGSAFHLMTIKGIPIRIHISLPLLLGFYFLSSLGDGLPVAIFTLIISLLVFVSIGLHELGHSFMAMRFGHRVRDIVLTLIGGVARLESMPRSPRQEMAVALAGPAVSLTLAAVGLTIGGQTIAMASQTGSSSLAWLGLAFKITGQINLILALFNLLPCFPMDGGRVFRAAMTERWGRLKATEIAMRAGQVICTLFILSGLFGFEGIPYFDRPSLFRILIGFFILNAAKQEYQMVLAEERMRQGGFRNPLEVLFGGRPDQGPPPPPPPRMRWQPPTPKKNDDTVEVGPSPYDDTRSSSRTHVEREQ
jgi:Zn-dependent protease